MSTRSSGINIHFSVVLWVFCLAPCLRMYWISLVWLYGSGEVAASSPKLQVPRSSKLPHSLGKRQNVFPHSSKSRALLWLEHLRLCACFWSNPRGQRNTLGCLDEGWVICPSLNRSLRQEWRHSLTWLRPVRAICGQSSSSFEVVSPKKERSWRPREILSNRKKHLGNHKSTSWDPVW